MTIESELNEQLTFFRGVLELDKDLKRYKDLCKLLEKCQELVDVTCSYKVDDTVYLNQDGLAKNGWAGAAHTLVVGRKATVLSRDFYRGVYILNLAFENETWIDVNGEEHLLDRPYSYPIAAHHVTRYKPVQEPGNHSPIGLDE